MSVLDEIIEGVRVDLAEREAAVPLDELKEAARTRRRRARPDARVPRRRASASSPRSSGPARARARSPTISDPAALAADYQAGGAATISVLTEQRRFGGSLADLEAVRAAVSVPVLRKDFIVTSYQLWEARAAGADLALLIVAALTQNQLEALVDRAQSIGLTPLVEVHDEEEVDRALAAGRDADRRQRPQPQDPRGRPGHLRPAAPPGSPTTWSGSPSPASADAHDVFEYAKQGAHVVLVGETLVKGDDPRAAVADLVAAGSHPALRAARLAPGARPHVRTAAPHPTPEGTRRHASAASAAG